MDTFSHTRCFFRWGGPFVPEIGLLLLSKSGVFGKKDKSALQNEMG